MKKVFFISVFFMLLITMPVFAEKTEAEHELGITKKLQYETARVLTFKDNKAVWDEIDSYDWPIKISNDYNGTITISVTDTGLLSVSTEKNNSKLWFNENLLSSWQKKERGLL